MERETVLRLVVRTAVTSGLGLFGIRTKTTTRRQFDKKNRHIQIRIFAFMALRIRSKTGYLLQVT